VRDVCQKKKYRKGMMIMTIFKLNKNALYALLLSVMALGMMAACSSSEESSDST
jgi:hypothetical protein